MAGDVWLQSLVKVMPKFFFSPNDVKDGFIHISGETAHHLLHVLRVKLGGEVLLCDGLGLDYYAELVESSSKTKHSVAVFKIKSTSPCDTEPITRITLFQSLPKGDKMDLIIQKCVELGVHEIQPVLTERSVARISSNEKKTARFQKISESAAEQSKRGIIPIIHPPCGFSAAIEAATESPATLVLLAYEQEHERSLKSVLLNNPTPQKNISLWIGPEGGFTDNEVSALCNAGAITITLGRRVLRTETAAIATIAQIICLCEEA